MEHISAQRQFAFGETARALLLVLDRRAIRLGAARAEGALVHLAARAGITAKFHLRRCQEALI